VNKFLIRPIFTALLLLFSGRLFAADRPLIADFLVIENPAQLIIYDRFQKGLSQEEKKHLGNYIPVRVVRWRDMLGDQITAVLKGDISGQEFFIALDEEGQPVNQTQAGFIKHYRKCPVVNDTVRIRSGEVDLYHPASPGTRVLHRLQKDERLVRIFKYWGYDYVRTFGQPVTYGWISERQKHRWEKVQTLIFREQPASLDEPTRQRILQRIAAANHSYQVIFDHFNRLKGKNETIPLWQIKQEDHALIFVLQPAEAAARLSRSTRVLLRDLRGLLIGSGWKLEYATGTIKIKPEA